MKNLLNYCFAAVLIGTVFLAESGAQEVKSSAKDDVMAIPADPGALAERDKAIGKIREILGEFPDTKNSLEGFTIQGDDPKGEILVNGVRLEDLDARSIAELLVALAEKLALEEGENLEDIEAQQEEMARMREIQEQNERMRQQQSIQRTQEILRQNQLQSQRPAAPPALPASRPPAPPSAPPSPSRR